jgi:light-regulated signal transduction histidine kinase (bacteriophytochrome)
MNNLLNYFVSLPCWLKVMGCLLLILLFGFADYLTGHLSVTVFYFFPIAFALWFIGKRIGFFITLLCCLGLFITDELVNSANATAVNFTSWNSLVEACFLLLSGYLVYKVKVEMELGRKKSIELQTTNQDLEAFNYTVAHDLRSHLNTLSLSCQAIEMMCNDRLDEECKGYVRNISNRTMQMNELIAALLTFSRMGHVEPHREKVDLCALAQEVVTMLQQTEPERQIDWRINAGIEANGDANLLRVVLDNLLGNAWKYTGKQEKTVIEFGVSEIKGVPTYFVRDNGIGFDKADQGKLFTPFQRLPGAETSQGFGIGLATVERIIKKHGGKVWAEGEPGKGACFFFTLATAGHTE